MHSAFLGLGSNIGERENYIQRALDLLTWEGAELVALSSFYETFPEGFPSPHNFVNAAAHVHTPLSAGDFLLATQDVERRLGRTHKSVGGVYADRTIDIDILLFDDATIATPTLTVPHPLMHRRAFVLEPLCEIAPHLVHPTLRLTISDLLAALRREQ